MPLASPSLGDDQAAYHTIAIDGTYMPRVLCLRVYNILHTYTVTLSADLHLESARVVREWPGAKLADGDAA
jgi:hypothetical protein